MSADGSAPARHDLVWLAAGWEGALAQPLAGDALSAVRAWIARGRPAVACRGATRVAGAVALGVALPPGGRLRRVAFSVRREAVARRSPPLALAAALPAAPPAWRAPLEALGRDAAGAGLDVRVYGSLAWQQLSGEAYLTAASDVDLLVAARDAGELRRALGLLRPRAGDDAPRLDGELLLPGGRGVAWRELARAPARLLVKAIDGVEVAPARAVLGPLAEETA
jgi:phosphoribosyl-dephospho-CoA transferase